MQDIAIRAETTEDIAAIHNVTRRAFAGKSFSQGDEPDLVDALRDAGALVLSLVAVMGREVVGHVAFSPALAADGTEGWFALGPISVAPEWQRRGIGGRLIRAGLQGLANLSARGCILIGDTGYYPAHGFVPRPDLAPPDEPAAYYMVQMMNGGPADTVVRFHPIFQGPDAT